MAYSRYPNCCGVFNLFGFSSHGFSYYKEKTPEKFETYVRKFLDEHPRIAFVTMVLTEDQEEKYHDVLCRLGFEVVTEGYNNGWRGSKLILLTKVMNEYFEEEEDND